jgi:carbon storage regulator
VLVLQRRRGERIVIGNDIIVEILRVEHNRVTIGVDAPKNIKVLREEALQRGKMGEEEHVSSKEIC